uniref:Uncharacterized protein n=1 Tax=Euplotes harpa TaxID=151035 RepID=A0A7S3JN92_9SPIT|mmetsp:Transcript_7597/g.8578  ORF Transcript_7597/g.8578 Transcript_7597/m.8578 type:complete len:133 (+) Transcript_7597:239-637(+)
MGLKEKSTLKTMFYGEDVEIKVLEGQNKILSAMYDDEKTDPDKLSKPIQKEITEVTQMKMDDIADVMKKYNQLSGFHKFLIKRRERGEPMPENSDELMDIYRYERPSFLFDRNKKTKYSKKERMYMFRAKHT